MYEQPFRQIHLDFHTSECIPGIGSKFDKKQFQDMLKLGHVASINLFAKGHHGWAYFDAKTNERHPNLDFDLLDAQIDAASEIGVRTVVYISSGLDEKMARRHPEWLMRDYNDRTNWVPDFNHPGYHQFCFNSPYLDYLLKQVEEVLIRYGNRADGIWLDIVGVRECYCQNCVKKAIERGINPDNRDEMMVMWEETYKHYTDSVRELVEKYQPTAVIFHNGGHIRRGRRDLAHMNTHLEIESLPTGGWGYQHFPLSARYAQTLGMEYLGMTGKFHTSWGEFGGYKHPNALRYEAALDIANGAKICVGDQLHPDGHFDEATYALIGVAYAEVEKKEAWCDNVTSVADVALLSTEAAFEFMGIKGNGEKTGASDAGAVKMLLEGKYLYDVIDCEADFSKYKVIILPDTVSPNTELTKLLKDYVAQGGRILATGKSAINADGKFVLDLGAEYEGVSSYSPTYFAPEFKPEPLEKASFVMYGTAYTVNPTAEAEVLGYLQNSYFNRETYHFCSHQHTPPKKENVSAGITVGKDGAYIAWDLFKEYDEVGELIYRLMFQKTLDTVLGEKKTLTTDLPAQGVVTVQDQTGEKRLVNHLLYASPVKRGKVEVIEDILPLYNIAVSIKTDKSVKGVYLAPQQEKLEYSFENGVVSYTVPKLDCHQMVVIDY